MSERGEALPSIHSRQSLLSFIRAHLGADGRLEDSVVKLPDDGPSVDGVSFQAGVFDAVMNPNIADDDVTARVEAVAELVAQAALDPTEQTLRALYESVSSDDAVELIDATLAALAGKDPSADGIAWVGEWLASTSPDRGPVKFGIGLLGLAGNPNPELLQELGAHEEFTLYVAVAYANCIDDAERNLFALAQRVSGWGRVHCVEMLADTTDPEIVEWLLLEGHRNDVWETGPALIAAQRANLADALATDSPSRELLTAAGEIIGTLLFGPVEIDDYEAAPTAIQRWLAHMDTRAATIGDLTSIRQINSFTERDGWEQRIAETTWTETDRERVRHHTAALMRDPRWPAVVDDGLQTADYYEFTLAQQAAAALGIDTFDRLLARIEADPIGGPWSDAWRQADHDRAQTLVNAATRLLGLDAIASGPTDELGLGPNFGPHQALNPTLDALRSRIGLGGRLLEAALASPSVQNRLLALAALEAWGPAEWSERQWHLVELAAANDPSERVRGRATDMRPPA